MCSKIGTPALVRSPLFSPREHKALVVVGGRCTAQPPPRSRSRPRGQWAPRTKGTATGCAPAWAPGHGEHRLAGECAAVGRLGASQDRTRKTQGRLEPLLRLRRRRRRRQRPVRRPCRQIHFSLSPPPPPPAPPISFPPLVLSRGSGDHCRIWYRQNNVQRDIERDPSLIPSLPLFSPPHSFEVRSRGLTPSYAIE